MHIISASVAKHVCVLFAAEWFGWWDKVYGWENDVWSETEGNGITNFRGTKETRYAQKVSTLETTRLQVK